MSDKNETRRFPLGQHHRDEIAAKSGRPLSELDLDRVRAGAWWQDEPRVPDPNATDRP